MRESWLLAVRNLRRNRRRSFATLLALAIGSSATLLFGGFKANINYMMHTHHVQMGGHLQIQHRDFHLHGNGNPMAYGIAGYEALVDAIKRDEVLGRMLLVASPTLQFGGIAGNYEAGVSRTVIGSGLVAEEVNRMRRWDGFGLDRPAHRSALEGAPQQAAVVGVGLARVLQLCAALKIERCPQPEKPPPPAGGAEPLPADIALLGSQDLPPADAPPPSAGGPRIELLVGSARGAPNVASLDVIRAEEQGFKEMDEVYVMAHLAQVQRLMYGRSKPRVTAIMLQLRHSHQIPAALERLRPMLSTFAPGQPLTILDFRALNPFYVKTIGMFDTIFGFIFVLIGGIVLFTVGNTMNTAVVERTVEIGTLRAMGLRRSGIRALFVVEGGLLGVLGAVLGVALALALSAAVNRMGFTWLPPANAEFVPLKLTVWGETPMILGTAASLVCVAVLSAWWPAYRAARLDVVDALRHA